MSHVVAFVLRLAAGSLFTRLDFGECAISVTHAGWWALAACAADQIEADGPGECTLGVEPR